MVLNFDEREKKEPGPVEEIELFTLDKKTYTMPKKLSANKLLGFMQEMRNSGQEAATVGLLIDCIGQSGYRKLLAYEGLEPSDLKAIFTVVGEAAMGAAEEMTGK